MNVTRGNGLLEPLLARLRARQANRLIPPQLRQGRILDIGCGNFPYFLAHTYFKEKFGIDQLLSAPASGNIIYHEYNLNTHTILPFETGFFNVVTMLAVIEHLNPEVMVDLFREIHRVLLPDGVLILTTPAAWANGLLTFLSGIGLVSKEEIDEHVYTYTLPLLGWYFGAAGFPMDRLSFGSFEFGMNLWATARAKQQVDASF